MLRKSLLWASTNPWMAERLPRYGFVRRAVRRFMPGEEASDALREAERLGARGASVIVTLLGENVADASEAGAVAEDYRGVMEDIRRRGVNAEVSVKPTHLGMDLGGSVALENVRRLARDAAELGCGTLWIDMEGSGYTDRTLELYRAVRADHENVGVALQAYLYRTEKDVDALLPLKPSIRLVKGAYMEPPSVAYPAKAEVDGAYQRLASRLLRSAKEGKTGRVAIATHDERMVRDAQTRVHELGLARELWEIEMLYGIGTGEQDRLLKAGVPLRVLISYGTHWFPWYMRRLAERPANLWFVARQMVKP